MKTPERVGWLLIGAAVGAGIALLYAPVAGKETRKLIRRRAEDAAGSVSEASGHVRERVMGASESVADAAREVYKKGATMAAGAAGLFEAGRKAAKS